MAGVLIVIVAGLLGLCWFLHTITWPLVRLIRAEWWHRAFEFSSALCMAAIGAIFGYSVGKELSGTTAAVIAAPLAAYSSFLLTTCSASAREFVGLPTMIERPRWMDAW